MNQPLTAFARAQPLDPALIGRVGHTIAAMGKPEFAPALDDMLSTVARFDLTCIFAYPAGRGPMLIHDGLKGVGTSQAMENYLKGTYLLDAVYFACSQGKAPGLYRLRDLAPDAFFVGEYYNSWEVHPCISMASGSLDEEICFIAPIGDALAAYSLMRSNGSGPFSDAEFERLRALEPIVAELLGQHWREPPWHAEPRRSGRDQAVLEDAFQSFGKGILTARETDICRMLLRGHSTTSISTTLGLAEGTVKNHCKHIYARLNISSRSELFRQFLNHIFAA
jgi:DNA-binding CsgD family transcriptional regulator